MRNLTLENTTLEIKHNKFNNRKKLIPGPSSKVHKGIQTKQNVTK